MLSLITAQFGQGITDTSGYFAQSSGDGINAFSNVELLISNMFGLITVLGGLFFIFFFVSGGFTWITAGGDSGKIEKARNQMVQGVIGLIILVASYAIIGLIGRVVGLNLLTPGAELLKLTPAAVNNAAGGAPTNFNECVAAGSGVGECRALFP